MIVAINSFKIATRLSEYYKAINSIVNSSSYRSAWYGIAQL